WSNQSWPRRATKSDDRVPGLGHPAVSARAAADAGEVLPRRALHGHLAVAIRRGRPLEHVAGEIEHAIRARARDVRADRHRVARPADRAVELVGLEAIAPRICQAVVAARRLLVLGLARQ